MTATATLVDGRYDPGLSDGTKQLLISVSLTNPYTAGGDSFSISGYFPNQFRGGWPTMVNPSVTTALAGIARTGGFRGDTASTSTAVLQFWNTSLAGASAGQYVDNTVANVSGTTLHCILQGR